MVFVPTVTDFLTSAQALFAPATSRLLIKYSGAGTLSLKVTDNKQTLTYRTKQKDDLKHMDKLSLHVLTACTGAAAAPAAGAGAGAGATARKAAPGSGAQRKRAAAEARLAAGKSAVGARTLARQQAKAQREAQRRSRRQERREERLLAGGGSSAAAL